MYYIQNPRREFKESLKAKKKEKKWEEFKSTWRILYYIQNPKSEFKEGLKAKKEKKRNEKNLNPPEGICITFRIPKGNSKKVWKPKKKRKQMRTILIHLKDFVLHSESQKAIQRMFES